MANNKIAEFWNGLPPYAKGIIAIVGTGVVVFAGYKIYKAVNKSDDEKKDKELLSAIDKEIKILKSRGLKQSYADSQYLQHAKTIHDAIKVCAGDDYGLAEDTLKLIKNDLDVALLIKAFGQREDFCFGISRGEFPLLSYVKKELGREWAGITAYRVTSINNDWKKKGITYQI